MMGEKFEGFKKYMETVWNCNECDAPAYNDNISIVCNYDNPKCIAFVYKYRDKILKWSLKKQMRKFNNFKDFEIEKVLKNFT